MSAENAIDSGLVDRSELRAAQVDLDEEACPREAGVLGLFELHTQGPGRRGKSPFPGQEPERRKWVVDALLVALILSELPEWIDLGIMRSLLDSWYDSYFDGDTVDLSLLWNTLEAEDEVTPGQAALPIAIFARLQPEHGLQARIPPDLEERPVYREARDQALVRVRNAGPFTALRNQVVAIRPTLQDRGVELQRFEKAVIPKKRKGEPVQPKSGRCLKVGWWVTGILAVVAVAWLSLSWNDLFPEVANFQDLERVSSMLRLSGGSRQGPALSAVIADPRWESMTGEQKREALRRIAVELRTEGIDSITLLDAYRMPVAAATAGQAGAGDCRVRLGAELYRPENPPSPGR